MNAGKIFLVLVGVMFVGSGICYAIWTQDILILSGMQIPTTVSKIDAWASYSGVQIGFGSWLLRSAYKNQAIAESLLMTTYIVGGLAILRTTGVVLFSSYDAFSLSALCFEIPISTGAWILYRKTIR